MQDIFYSCSCKRALTTFAMSGVPLLSRRMILPCLSGFFYRTVSGANYIQIIVDRLVLLNSCPYNPTKRKSCIFFNGNLMQL